MKFDLEKALDVCEAEFLLPRERLTLSARFWPDLEKDSYDRMYLSIAPEEAFGVEIDDKDLIACETLGQLLYLVEYQLK